MSDPVFPKGIFFKLPNEKAPDFVKGSISIKKDEAIDWISSTDGDWVNLDLKVGKSGKAYAQVNDWKPEGKEGKKEEAPSSDFPDDDIPF